MGTRHARDHQHLGVFLGEHVEVVRQPGVEEGSVPRLEHRPLVAQSEPEPTLDDVQPFLAFVLVELSWSTTRLAR